MAGGFGEGGSSSSCWLPYCGPSSVGLASHCSTGVITLCVGGVVSFPVRWGRCDRSSQSSW
eukprot:576328-Prymnesium_polylepis.1